MINIENKKILPIIFIGIITIFYYDTFKWLVESWKSNPYYSHGFLVLLVSGYIIWKLKYDLANTEIKEKKEGLILFIIGIGLQIIATSWTIRFLSGISLIIVIYGTILYLFGNEFVKKIRFPILFLLLAIPIPFMEIMASPAQMISAIGADNVASLAGLPVHREGLLLHMPTATFEVALECSGLYSVISLLTISIIYAFILEGGLLMKVVIVLSSIPLAMIGNISRISLMLGIAQTYGTQAAIDYFHDFSSALLFSVALIGLFLVGRCFGRLRFKI